MGHIERDLRDSDSGQVSNRVKRDAFLYLDPKGKKETFAQCSTCMMWLGKEKDLCSIHGKDVEVTGDMSCGLYVHGMPMPDMHVMKAVTPHESGLYKGKVRCGNCHYFDEVDECLLYTLLNQEMPEHFDLDPTVDEQGCCNAFIKH